MAYNIILRQGISDLFGRQRFRTYDLICRHHIFVEYFKKYKSTYFCISSTHYFNIFLLAKRNLPFIICTPYKLTTNSSQVLKQNKTPNKLLNKEQMIGFQFPYRNEFAISFFVLSSTGNLQQNSGIWSQRLVKNYR